MKAEGGLGGRGRKTVGSRAGYGNRGMKTIKAYFKHI